MINQESTFNDIKEDLWLFTITGKTQNLKEIVFFPDESIGHKFAHKNSSYARSRPNQRFLTEKEMFTIQILREN